MSVTAIDEIEAALQGWLDAYRERDIATLLDTAIGEEIQVVGTGADEVRFGLAEFRTQIERDFSQSGDAQFSFSNLHTSVFGDAAFAYADITVSGSVGGQHFEMSGLRMTAGLVRTDDGWRFAQSHLSAPDGSQSEGSSFEG